MPGRQPQVAQRQLGTDVITNNGVDKVVGLMGVALNNPIVAASMPYVDQNSMLIYWVTTIPASMIPPSLLSNPNEVEFNYRFQGGF